MKLHNLFIFLTLMFLFLKIEKTYDCKYTKYTKNFNISYIVYDKKHCPPLKNYLLSGFALSKNKNYNALSKNKNYNGF